MTYLSFEFYQARKKRCGRKGFKGIYKEAFIANKEPRKEMWGRVDNE